MRDQEVTVCRRLERDLWLDLRGYNPVEGATARGRPMLILQAGRDYQASVVDNSDFWAKGRAK